MKKTYHPTKEQVTRERHEVDADGEVLGRLATHVATLLMGKHKATYSPHMDPGDFVTIKNASKVKVTGKKALQKIYYKHSGYPGGLKAVSYKKLSTEQPEKVIEHAVRGMLPKNRLQDIRMRRLRFT